jgi:hypothetical protein
VSDGTGRNGWTARRARRGIALALAVSALALAPGLQAQAARVPFGVGEELVYRASSSRFGRLGTGTMRVTGPEEVAGRRAFVLGFDFDGRMGPAVIRDRTRSWFDSRAMASVRYTKTERSPLGSRSEDVRMDLADRRWASAGGEQGAIPTAAPLDELSFLFFIRTLPLEAGAAYDLNRHFDTRRNPVQVRVLGRQQTTVPAGTFRTVAVEMRVHDPERYKGGRQAVIRLFLTDDECRIPVRIESSMPFVGSVTMALQSATHADRAAGSAN